MARASIGGEVNKVSERRFEDLEVRLAFQEQTLNELNAVVTRQQATIDRLEQRCDALLERLRSLGEGAGDEAPDERPPHY